MNPIKGADEVLRQLSIRPKHATESDIVRSPGPDDNVRFGLVENGVANTVQKLKDLKDNVQTAEDSLQSSVEKLNSEMRQRRISLSFSIDKDTESVVVRVVDTTSGKVIRQIPPDEILSLRRHFEEMAGKLIDKHI